jgi:predicted metal-binding protein
MGRQGGDFRTHDFGAERFGLIILGNFLHAYDPQTSQELLTKSCALLRPDGLLLIHDYFPDRQPGAATAKASLYDLHMLANTYNGCCRPAAEIADWLAALPLATITTVDLASDSSLILASRPGLELPKFATNWPQIARECGFRKGVEIHPSQVVTASWVRGKCECGCPDYGRNLHCPPHGRSHSQTAELLASYDRALLVEGTPPGRDFHRQLLDLERRAFLAGHHKALVLGAGPCPVCNQCPSDGPCRFPAKARAAMEACGIDVYATATAAGIHLLPLTAKDQYVKYIGLLLIS